MKASVREPWTRLRRTPCAWQKIWFKEKMDRVAPSRSERKGRASLLFLVSHQKPHLGVAQKLISRGYAGLTFPFARAPFWTPIFEPQPFFPFVPGISEVMLHHATVAHTRWFLCPLPPNRGLPGRTRTSWWVFVATFATLNNPHCPQKAADSPVFPCPLEGRSHVSLFRLFYHHSLGFCLCFARLLRWEHHLLVGWGGGGLRRTLSAGSSCASCGCPSAAMTSRVSTRRGPGEFSVRSGHPRCRQFLGRAEQMTVGQKSRSYLQ